MHRKFLTYHPYLTFSDGRNTSCFIDPNGNRREDLSPSADALFLIGSEAFKRLPKLGSRKDFDSALSAYYEFIGELRLAYRARNFVCKNHFGDVIDFDWSDAEDQQVVEVAWQLMFAVPSSVDVDLYAELFLFRTLRAIDDAIIAMDLDSMDAISLAIDAANSLANATAITSGSEKLQKARQDMAYQGAIARLARDPRQREKKFVYECWLDWQKQPDKCKRYKGKAAFARDMLSKCEHLASQKKIEDWCRNWEKS